MDILNALSYLAIMGVAIMFLWNTVILGHNYKERTFYFVYIFMLMILFSITSAFCIVIW